jgi:hypothetical protein
MMQSMAGSRRLCASAAVLCALAAACGGGPARPSPFVPVTSNVLVGAGDIAVCGSQGTVGTAALLDTIAGTVFTAGDNVYERGTADEFARCYEPTWGRHKSRTRPAPGNHDYGTGSAAAYFAYFGDQAGTPGLGYYSFSIGDWHILSLNSNIPAGQGSPQYEWLRADLQDNRAACTAAIWHHPVFSSGRNGPQSVMRDTWRLLQESGAEFVVNGHDHLYERFARLDALGRPNAGGGLREFIAGTGGGPLYEFHGVSAGSEARLVTWGVLKFTLEPNGYEWQFLSLQGGVVDSGRDICR